VVGSCGGDDEGSSSRPEQTSPYTLKLNEQCYEKTLDKEDVIKKSKDKARVPFLLFQLSISVMNLYWHGS
jgi:hypothetical protein